MSVYSVVVNSVRHLITFLIIGIVAYHSFSDGISFFALHSPLMLIGFLLLMTESVMVFPNDRAFNQKLTNYSNRLNFHSGLQFCAGICIALGLLSIQYAKKNENVDAEEPSFHSNIGYTAVQAAGGAFCGGILARYGRLVMLPVKFIRIGHAFFGCVVYIMGLCGICTGLNSEWMHSHVSESTICRLMGAVILIGIGAIYKPCSGVCWRVSKLVPKRQKG